MRKLIVVLFLIFITYNISAAFYGLIDPDEPRYAATAKNMVLENQYIIPYFNGNLRINKPPLTYWLIAASYKMFKINEYFSRLPHILFAFFIIFFGVLLFKSHLSYEERVTFALILASTPLFFYLGKYCNTDIILSGFFIFSIYFFYLYIEKERAIFLNLFYISYFFTNLTKGPVAYLIILIILLFLFFEKSIKKLYNLKFWLIVLFLSLTPFLYLLLVSLKVNHSLNIIHLITTETVGRFFKGYRHPEPIYFYLKFFPLLFFPWSIFFIYKIFNLKNLWGQNSFNRLNIIYFFTVFIFFSLSRSKLLSYILPITFPFAYLTVNLIRDVDFKIKSNFFIIIYGALFLLLVSFLLIKKYLIPDYSVLLILLFFVVVYIVLLKYENNFLNKFAYFQMLLLLTVFLLGSNFLSENKSEKFLQKVTLEKKIPIISYRRDITGIAFYKQNYLKVDNINDLEKFKNFYMVSYKSDFKKVEDKLKFCNKLAESKLKILVKCNEPNN